MVKTRVLIKNELIKLFNRKIVIILYIVLAVLTALSALTNLVSTLEFSYSLLDDAEYYEDCADDPENEYGHSGYFDTYRLEDIGAKVNEKELAALRKEECLTAAKMYRAAYDIGVKSDGDFRFRIFNEAVNKVQFVVLRNAMDKNLYPETVDALLSAYEIDRDDVYSRASEAENGIEQLKDITFKDFIKPYYNEAIKQYDEILTYAPSDDALECEKYSYDVSKTAAKAIRDFYAYAYEKCPTDDMPQCHVAQNGIDTAEQLLGYTVVSEKDYYSESNVGLRYDTSYLLGLGKEMTYEQYVAKCKKEANALLDQIAVAYRCIETNGYDIAAGGHTRSATFGFFGGSFMFLIFATVVFSTVLTNEYSTRTIHMLMIRPATRSKILASKYIASGITSTLLYWGAALLHFLISGAVTGFDDITQSVYFNIFGILIEVPYLIHYLLTLIVCTLGILMLGMFAFMVTTTAKSAAGGIVLTMVVGVMMPTVTTIIAAICGMGFFTYNPMAYIPIYSTVNCGILTGNNFSILGMITGDTAGPSTDIILGTLVTVVFLVLFTLLAHLRFNRKDIK